jgi:hypothetical protein
MAIAVISVLALFGLAVALRSLPVFIGACLYTLAVVAWRSRMVPFEHSFNVQAGVEDAKQRFDMTITKWLLVGGFSLVDNQPNSVTLQREYRSGAVYLVCILLFPIGLLALLVDKKKQPIMAAFRQAGSGTEITMTGTIGARDAGRLVRALSE